MFTPISPSMKSTNRHGKWHRSCLQSSVLLFMWAFLDPYNPQANMWFIVTALQELCFYRLFLCSSIKFGSGTSRCLEIFVRSLDCSWAVLVLWQWTPSCWRTSVIEVRHEECVWSAWLLVQMIVRIHSFFCRTLHGGQIFISAHITLCRIISYCIISYRILSWVY